MKHLLVFFMTLLVISGCGMEKQKDWSDIAPEELTEMQKIRWAEVMSSNFRHDQKEEVEEWLKEARLLNAAGMQQEMERLVPEARELDKIPDDRIGNLIRKLNWEPVSRIYAEDIPGADYRVVEEASKKIFYLYLKNNEDHREMIFEQMEDPVGRKLAEVYFNNIRYIIKGE